VTICDPSGPAALTLLPFKRIPACFATSRESIVSEAPVSTMKSIELWPLIVPFTRIKGARLLIRKVMVELPAII